MFTNSLTDDAQNEPIQIQLTVDDVTGTQVEEYLNEHISSSDTMVVENVLSFGQMDIEDVSRGSVVLQLRPVTDQAVKNLLNAKQNHKLADLIFGILKKVHIDRVMNETNPIRVSLQVVYASLNSNIPGKFQGAW